MSLRELQSRACLLQLLAEHTMDDGWDNCLLERSSSSLSLASSQTSVVAPRRPKKSSSLHKQPTDAGKKTSLNARSSCRVQTAVALPKQPTAFSLLMPRWKRRTPIGDGLPGSWLQMEMVSGRKQLVCRACAHFKPSADSLAHILTTEGDKPRIANILRHGRRVARQQNLKLFRKHLFGSGPEVAKLLLELGAPSTEEFESLWRALRIPSSTSKQMRQSARRAVSIEWCLYEAIRDKQRKFASEASTIGVALDERKGHSLVTFRACAGLEVCHGILAAMKDAGKSAAHIAQAIHKAVEIFCSPRREHPGMNPVLREPGQQDKADAAQAKQRILERFEMVSADGASNGQVAARMMHPKVQRSSSDIVELPFLKIVLIDKAHSSRRIPERTFRHDPDMTRILTKVMLDPGSVANTLQYSEQLMTIFKDELGRQQRSLSCKRLSSDMRNLSFAKQRFDSLAKPLARCVPAKKSETREALQ